MKIVVTHTSPDLDAICSVWLTKRFLAGWENAEVRFVLSGERLRVRGKEGLSRLGRHENFLVPQLSRDESQGVHQRIGARQDANSENFVPPRGKNSSLDAIEKIDDNEMIHVDTGLGPLDHHLTSDESISASSLVWDYIKKVQNSSIRQVQGKVQSSESERMKDKSEAIGRIVKVVTDIDHFREALWENPTAFYHDFAILGILDGLKLEKPNDDNFYVDFISQCLDAILHDFENRVWAEKEIAEKGIEFKTRWGKGLGVETVNDSVIKLAQKMGYAIVVRRDPRKGYVRIKARPSVSGEKGADLTLVYEKFKKMDPQASWFLHVSKKMLLNGSAKNPKMRASRLTLKQIIQVLEKI
ncbi:MAG: hypothetical protein ABH816_04205 [Candidatus Levyibacteriota bacterium]